MNKKIALLLAVCVIAVIAALVLQLRRYTYYGAGLAQQVSAQQKTITGLTAERNALARKKPPACPPAATATTPQTDVQSVFEPQSSDAQGKIDTLKKRYEDILVTYFVLRKCNKNNPMDYHVIISALAQEMASINAPGRLQYDILTSAQGSYKELYSAGNCDAKIITPLMARYKVFIDATAKQFLPR